MLDQQVRPVYDDSLFCAGLCLGEPMGDMNGIPLNPEHIRGYLLTLMEPGKAYKREELQEIVTLHHKGLGGKPPDVLNPADQFKKALATLKEQGRLENPSEGFWRLSGEGTIKLPSERNLEIDAAQNAEVVVGEGAAMIYGWYFPAYRKLAALEGKEHFPIKVSLTVRDPQKRLQESGGMAPERPVLGFVFRVDDAGQWEQLIHSKLSLKGRRIEDAIGREWFDVSLDELRELALAEMAEINRCRAERDGNLRLVVVQQETNQ